MEARNFPLFWDAASDPIVEAWYLKKGTDADPTVDDPPIDGLADEGTSAVLTVYDRQGGAELFAGVVGVIEPATGLVTFTMPAGTSANAAWKEAFYKMTVTLGGVTTAWAKGRITISP